MKKAMLLAIAALCVSAAQAVTFTWLAGAKIDATTGTTFGPDSGSTLTDGTTSSTSNLPSGYTLVASLAISSTAPEAATGILKVAQWGASNSWVSVNTNGTLNVSTALGSGVDYTTTSSVLGTTVDIAITYSFNESDYVIVTYYVNGTRVGSAYNYSKMDNAQWQASWDDGVAGSTTNDVVTSYNVAVYDRVLDTSDLTFMATNHTTLVPEPTVLALLALGVAGIALRRRA